jgi:hypothetical protein
MRVCLFILGVFAALVCFEKPAAAQNYPCCAYYDMGTGATNCGFATSQQCLAAVSGVGGNCGPNPAYQSVPRPYPLTNTPGVIPIEELRFREKHRSSAMSQFGTERTFPPA